MCPLSDGRLRLQVDKEHSDQISRYKIFRRAIIDPVRTNEVASFAMKYTLNVNGRAHLVDVDGDTPLLWVLRDSIDLKGTKFGCGAGLCGRCTVHLDDAAP